MNSLISIFIIILVYSFSHNFIYATLGSLIFETLYYLASSNKKKIKNLFFLFSWIFVGLSLTLNQPLFIQLKLSIILFFASMMLLFNWFSCTSTVMEAFSISQLDHQNYCHSRNSLVFVFLMGAIANLIAVCALPILYWYYFKIFLSFCVSLSAYKILSAEKVHYVE